MSELLSNEQEPFVPPYDILLIEDDLATGEMLTECIESESTLRVWTLQSGEETLMHLQEHREVIPSLIIIDYLLPGMNGLQLIDHLQNFKNFKHIPAIMITAATVTDAMQTTLQNRNILLLTKPLDLNELIDALEFIHNNNIHQLL